jgi:ethanolamine utilization microcompartment shell protein EutL
MQENFLANDSELPSAEVDFQASSAPVSRKEFVKVMVIGSRKGIASVIKTLHHLRQTVSE